jgi:hypothetical protein
MSKLWRFILPVHRATYNDDYWSDDCELPYGLEVNEIRAAVDDIYNFFQRINTVTIDEDLGYFEHLVLGNTLSGMISEFVVKRIAEHSQTLEANVRVGGHPDLVPVGMYPGASILRGEEGVEIKSSIQKGGWQGHNPEECWIIIFRYIKTKTIDEVYFPIQFVEILAAQLELDDWSLAERQAESRRTRTTSINVNGMEKLRSNPVYRNPEYGVGRFRNPGGGQQQELF